LGEARDVANVLSEAAGTRDLLSSGNTFVEHDRTIVAVVPHVDFDGAFAVVKQPCGWILLFTLWLVVAGDDFEVCHCRISFLFHLLRDRLGSDCVAGRFTDDAVLAQDSVGYVFQLGYDSKPRALAPFNDIRLVVHCLTSFPICTTEPA
jgi:hypothetical protein